MTSSAQWACDVLTRHSFYLSAMNQTSAVADISEVAAWYGKLSSLGDFAQRRMPAELFAAFDNDHRHAAGVQRLGHLETDVSATDDDRAVARRGLAVDVSA